MSKSSTQADPKAQDGGRRPSETQIKVVTSIIDSLKSSQFSELPHHFPLILRFFLTEARLKSLWENVGKPLGSILSYEQPILAKKGRFLSSIQTLILFERGSHVLSISLDPWNSVLGFSMIPPIKAKGLVPAWTSPAYVKETDFSEEEIWIRPSWISPAIQCLLTVPKPSKVEAGRYPAVIILGGSGPSDADASLGSNLPLQDIAWGLASSGIAVLRMEKPLLECALGAFGTGYLTVETEYVRPTAAAFKALCNRKEVDPDRIFLLGASLGGRVAPRAAASIDAMRLGYRVRGIISCAGNTSPLPETILRQIEYGQRYCPRSQEEYEKEWSEWKDIAARFREPDFERKISRKEKFMGVPASYLLDLAVKENHPIKIMNERLSNTPILVLQGDKDWQVLVDHDLKGWREGLTGVGGRATVKVFEGLNHCFMRSNGEGLMLRDYDVPGHVEKQVVMDVVEWIRNH
ncbi:MAG: hypothetical protein Q9227_008502 [Pyrenula ochraceoflavens]